MISENYSNKTLRELAVLWEISAPTLSRVFNGKKADLETILTIAFYCDINIEYGIHYK